MKQLAIALCLMLVAGFCFAELNAIGKTRTATNRIDVDTNGKWSTMEDAYYSTCVVWQTFSNNDGVNAYDLTTYTNDAAATNANTLPAWNTTNGGCRVFDGIDDYMVSSGNASFDFDTNDAFSVSLWVRREAAFGAWVGNSKTTLPRKGWLIGGGGFGIEIRFGMGAAVLGDAGIIVDWTAGLTTSNVFDFVCATYEGTGKAAGVTLYRNGQAVPMVVVRDNADDSSLTGGRDLRIGNREYTPSPLLLKGALDDIRVFRRLLSSNEQYQIYVAEPLKANGGKR